jgi:hypothetical protein
MDARSGIVRREITEGVSPMPTGGGSPKDRKAKKKSKEQLEKELKKRSSLAPVESMTFEVIKPKRKERDF